MELIIEIHIEINLEIAITEQEDTARSRHERFVQEDR